MLTEGYHFSTALKVNTNKPLSGKKMTNGQTVIAAEAEAEALRAQLSDCRRPNHDISGVSYVGGGKWRTFCTEFGNIVYTDRAALAATWKAAA